MGVVLQLLQAGPQGRLVTVPPGGQEVRRVLGEEEEERPRRWRWDWGTNFLSRKTVSDIRQAQPSTGTYWIMALAYTRQLPRRPARSPT